MGLTDHRGVRDLRLERGPEKYVDPTNLVYQDVMEEKAARAMEYAKFVEDEADIIYFKETDHVADTRKNSSARRVVGTGEVVGEASNNRTD